MMTMEAHFEYSVNNKTKVINVTSDYVVDNTKSNCSSLTITSGTNDLTFTFEYGTDNKTYHLEEVDVDFSLVKMVKKEKLDIGEVAIKASYVCNSGAKVDFGNGEVLIMKNLQFQAFTMDGSKYSTASSCTSDFSAIIPIIVGAVLAGIVLLVVIAYILGRRRTRTGYEEI